MLGPELATAAVAAFAAVFVCVSLVGLAANRFRRQDELPSLEGWALAGRQFGPWLTWFVLGGAVYTAYTFIAVPALVYGVGALGFFAVPYTIMVWPIAFLILPRLWAVARRNGYVTSADFVQGRYGSSELALAVALTGVLATMPYIALQLVGMRALLVGMGVPAEGTAGDLALSATFAVLAAATYTSGLRAPALISLVKAVLVFAVTLLVLAAATARLGGVGPAFVAAEADLAARTGGTGSLVLDHRLDSAFATLAVGSALALLVYPHVLTSVFAADRVRTLRTVSVAMPAWTAVLALLAMLGVAASAAHIRVAPGHAELAGPLLVRQLFAEPAAGLVLGVIGIGALVPAAIMSIAVATLVTRNVYVAYIHPSATPKHQATVARFVSIVVKVGALAFVFGLDTQEAINLQLLGGVWVLQTFPAVVLGLYQRWLHRHALMAGWVVGMVAGTTMVASQGFAAVVPVSLFGLELQIYAALLALALNLLVAVLVTPVLVRLGVPHGLDRSGLDQSPQTSAAEWLEHR